MPKPVPKPGRRTTAALVLAVVILLLAWYQGGERAIRPIEQDIAVPVGVL